MKTARERLDILTTYRELGSYRATAALCGTTHKTVRRVVERRSRPPLERPPRSRNTDIVRELIAKKVEATDGRISAKRLLPVCRAAGYTGSARSLRRAVAVAEAKAEHRRDRRGHRPWLPVPGEHLVIDWGEEDGMHVFCAVLAWSRWRFVRFAGSEDQATTLALLAECFEAMGGVPSVVLSDRMGCLKGGIVADVVVPAPGYVAFAAHYGFDPDLTEAADPESKGVVEHLVGYAKSDLLVGLGPWSTSEEANGAASAWCTEVNGRVHSETAAVPDERLAVERSLLRPLPGLRPTLGPLEVRTVDTLRTVRFRSARYSVPGACPHRSPMPSTARCGASDRTPSRRPHAKRSAILDPETSLDWRLSWGEPHVAPDGSLWIPARLGEWDNAGQPVCDRSIDGVARFDGEAWSRFLQGYCIQSMDIADDGSVWLLATESDARFPLIRAYVIIPEAEAAAE